MVGKWHLGHADKKYWPQNRGFDHFYGNVVGEVDYFTRERGGLVDWQRNGKFLKEQGYYTELIGERCGAASSRATTPPSRCSSTSPRWRRTPRIKRPQKYVDALQGHDQGSDAAHLCGDDHRARRPGRPDRRGARKEEDARQHDHRVRQRQRRCDQRAVRDRRAIRGGAQGERRCGARRQAAGVERRPARRQGQPPRGRCARADDRQLAGEAQARASSTSRCTWWT